MKLLKLSIPVLAFSLMIASCGTGDDKTNNMDIPTDNSGNGQVVARPTDTQVHTNDYPAPPVDTNSQHHTNGSSTSNGVTPREEAPADRK